MDTTIVIVNWNTYDILRDCLCSIYTETKRLKFEVIVIDNASTDGSTAMVKNQFPQVVLLENSGNRGFAAANNQGIAIAKGRYILLLNSDTIILENAIRKTISFADVHPEAAVVGCRVLSPDRTLQPTCFMFPSICNMVLSSTYIYKIFPRNRFFGRERMSWWDRCDEREVDVVTGCFMLVRREAIEQVGLMDEQFFVYGEETDWCYRFKQAGWKNIFIPNAQIIHLGGASSKRVATEMALQLRGSILQFIHKHRSRWEYGLACFLVWLFCAVRIPVWFVRFLFSRQDRKYNWGRMKIYVIAAWRIIRGGGKALCIHDNR
ncbi:MAG: glycosyltransferase family 2 protein [Planctomycetes bacterium]|nr:glycosyltransferase family 2 protein [Planctomycetota bacterium]